MSFPFRKDPILLPEAFKHKHRFRCIFGKEVYGAFDENYAVRFSMKKYMSGAHACRCVSSICGGIDGFFYEQEAKCADQSEIK